MACVVLYRIGFLVCELVYVCCDVSVVSSMSLCFAGRLVRELAVAWRWLVLCRLCPELELRCVGCLVRLLAVVVRLVQVR